jgi:Ca2+/Na+ antiporter
VDSILKKFSIENSYKKKVRNHLKQKFMSTEEKNNLKGNESEPIQVETRSKFIDKLVTFLKNNKAATVLSLLLLVVLTWFSGKLSNSERNFNNEKTRLISQYESTIDSLQINYLEFATKVFSWSVRSELLRNNTDNLNQLLTVFVKESGADLVQLINPEDNTVLLSSDKKYEGKPYTGNLNFELNSPIVQKEGSDVKIITPVMGFTNKIGVLIVELYRK